MKEVKIGRHRVEMYDAIDELPIVRFHKYNKMLLVDAGIGSDLADFDRHIEKAMRFAASKTPQDAVQELQNLRQCVYFIQTGLSPKHLAFAALVRSIDGMPCDDVSDDALRKVVEMLSDAPHKDVVSGLEAGKKKIDAELREYFPSLFDDAELKEYYDRIKARTIAGLGTNARGGATEEDERKIDAMTDALVTYFHPQSFAGAESVEIQHDKQFEKMCLILSQNLNVDPKGFTVLQYYNAFEFVKEQAKKNKARNGAKQAVFRP